MKVKPDHNKEGEQTGYRFTCPGCGSEHSIAVRPHLNHCGAGWVFNGNMDTPTFTPSLMVKMGPMWPEWSEAHGGRQFEICHSFIIEGRIQFLSDCTHKLAGQTVDLPDIT